MIDKSMIPMEVKRAMCIAWAKRKYSDSREKHMTDLAVAALAAWPNTYTSRWVDGTPVLILPLTEARDERSELLEDLRHMTLQEARDA